LWVFWRFFKVGTKSFIFQGYILVVASVGFCIFLEKQTRTFYYQLAKEYHVDIGYFGFRAMLL